MEGLVIDVIMVLLTLGMGIVGVGLAWEWWNKQAQKRALSDPRSRRELMEHKGKDNLEEFKIEESRMCLECKKLTDPKTDLFINGCWYHKQCWKLVP